MTNSDFKPPIADIPMFPSRYLEHVRDEITQLALRGDVTYEEYEQLRMNSYERQVLYPRLTDDALARVTLSCLQQCSSLGHPVPSTYDEAVKHVFTPLLINRLYSLSQLKFVAVVVGIRRSDTKQYLFGFHVKTQCWAFPAGKVQSGETILNCAVRETKEETNLDIEDIYPFKTVDNQPKWVTHYFRATATNPEELRDCEPDKHHSFGWYDQDKPPELTKYREHMLGLMSYWG